MTLANLLRLYVLLLFVPICATAFGESDPKPAPCSSGALQLHLLPLAESVAISGAFLLVFEVQNIEAIPCTLSNPSAELLPENNGEGAASNSRSCSLNR